MSFIVIIDQEPIVLELVSTIMRLDGYRVSAFYSISGIQSAVRAPEPIDLLIADADLLPSGAVEFLDRIKDRYYDFPVIFTSGYPCTVKVIADALGSEAIVEKPFTPAQLRTAVRKQLNRTPAKLLAMTAQ